MTFGMHILHSMSEGGYNNSTLFYSSQGVSEKGVSEKGRFLKDSVRTVVLVIMSNKLLSPYVF